ncbi:MAG: hypothetical protein WCL38_07625, partial [Actinomycetota bacterium]
MDRSEVNEGTTRPSVTQSRAFKAITALHASLLGALVSLALGVEQLLMPGALHGEPGFNVTYDQGVYFGAALRLTMGQVPYRDFVLVHPPGIVFLLQPWALIGRVAGTGVGLVMAQMATVVVVALNCFLVGYLVRKSGRAAALVASMSLAFWPFAVHVNALVELEPYVLLFILLAMVVVTSERRGATPNGLFLVGVLVAAACTVKVWGFYPAVALTGFVVVARRQYLLRFLAGIGTVFVLFWAPFLLACGRPFIHDILVSQLQRKGYIGTPQTAFIERFLSISGFADIFYGATISTSTALVLLTFGAFSIGLVALFGWWRTGRTETEWCCLAVGVTTFIGMITMTAPNYTSHYAYLPAALLAPLLGLLIASPTRAVARATRGERLGAVGLDVVCAGVALTFGLLAVLVFLPTVRSVTSLENSSAFDPSADLKASIPAGACTLADFPSDLIAADRYLSSTPGCPPVVDPFGMFLTEDQGNQPHVGVPEHPIPPAFGERWHGYLEASDYVVMSVPFTSYISWTTPLVAYFKANYGLVTTFTYPLRNGGQAVRYVYVNRRSNYAT